MNKSAGLFIGISCVLSVALADVCQADEFTGRYIIVSETSDKGGSISGYIEFENALVSNQLALVTKDGRGVKEVSITYTEPGKHNLTVDLSHYKKPTGKSKLRDIIGFDGTLGAPVLTPVFHHLTSTNASWEFSGDLDGHGEQNDVLKLLVFNLDGDITTPGQTRWTVLYDDLNHSPDLGTDWALRTFSPVWWLVLDTNEDGTAEVNIPDITMADQNDIGDRDNSRLR